MERALALRSEHEGTERYLAETRFVLAAALAAAGKDPQRATELALEAKKVLEAGPPGDAEFLPEINAWLAARAP
jgi:hypothetical protein